MSFLQIQSTHPEFSFLLKKNPESGMIIKELRKGKLFGWYSENDTFNVYFKDSGTEVSYIKDKDEQFEYLNTSRYNSALFVTHVFKEFFPHLVKLEEVDSQKEEQKNTIVINLIHIKASHYIEFFTQRLPEFSLNVEEVAKNNYKIEITNTSSLNRLCAFTNLFAIFCAITNEEYIFINPDVIEKYIQMLNWLDAPYFIRYLFKIKFINDFKTFEKYKNLLESSFTEHISMSFGTNKQARKSAIKQELDFGNSIIDLGCGEGYYLFDFVQKLQANTEYIAIDIDEKLLDFVRLKAVRRDIKNTSFYSSFNEFVNNHSVKQDKYDIILSEVIEHMEQDKAAQLITEVLAFGKINTFIITTPNKDFNQFYFDTDEEKRHEDHQFEIGESEFEKWIESIVESSKYTLEFIKIGDIVNNCATTNGVIIKKLHSNN